MKILCIGDVTSPAGVGHLERKLRAFRRERAIDLCVVNGENASLITGISPDLAERLFLAGADVISGGNHTLRNKAAYRYLDDTACILRPLNFGDGAPGHGYCITEACGKRVLVACAMGNVHIDPVLDSPFDAIEKMLKAERGNYDLALLDIHAEATGEKLAVAHAFDGEFSVIFGTHTHVPTADLQILPKGTGYVTDLGMCGETGGILGMNADDVVLRVRSHLPIKFSVAPGACAADGCIFTIDQNGRTVSVERVRI